MNIAVRKPSRPRGHRKSASVDITLAKARAATSAVVIPTAASGKENAGESVAASGHPSVGDPTAVTSRKKPRAPSPPRATPRRRLSAPTASDIAARLGNGHNDTTVPVNVTIRVLSIDGKGLRKRDVNELRARISVGGGEANVAAVPSPENATFLATASQAVDVSLFRSTKAKLRMLGHLSPSLKKMAPTLVGDQVESREFGRVSVRIGDLPLGQAEPHVAVYALQGATASASPAALSVTLSVQVTRAPGDTALAVVPRDMQAAAGPVTPTSPLSSLAAPSEQPAADAADGGASGNTSHGGGPAVVVAEDHMNVEYALRNKKRQSCRHIWRSRWVVLRDDGRVLVWEDREQESFKAPEVLGDLRNYGEVRLLSRDEVCIGHAFTLEPRITTVAERTTKPIASRVVYSPSKHPAKRRRSGSVPDLSLTKSESCAADGGGEVSNSAVVLVTPATPPMLGLSEESQQAVDGIVPQLRFYADDAGTRDAWVSIFRAAIAACADTSSC